MTTATEAARSDRFVSLHNHTEFSLLDGLATVQEYVDRASEIGQPALGISDHGNICGAPEHYAACLKAGIEPVIGQEFYYVDDFASTVENKVNDRYHISVFARGERGYRVLSEMSTAAHGQFYYKPTLDRPLIEAMGDARDELVVLSGCAGSALSRALRDEDDDAAVEQLTWWREMFPHYYVELMHHDTTFDRQLNLDLVDLAKRYDVPWVITNDPHYVDRHDHDNHDAMLAIQTGSDIDDPKRFAFDGQGYYLKSRAQMRRAFSSYGDEVWKPGARNTLRIARDCRIRVPAWDNRVWQIPSFPDVGDETADEMLARMTQEGLEARGLWGKRAYRVRARHELKVMKQVGISDFMLITADLIRHARSIGIPVGPGRGSVCGTLVGLGIGVHKMDPIRYNLMFERFLNPERPRMPDIDTDFGQRRRKEMFDYAAEKYGAENVVMVAAYGRMRAKRAFQSLGKVYGIPYGERLRLSAGIVSGKEGEPDLIPEEIVSDYPELARRLDKLSDYKASMAAHPAGVIIADPTARISEQVPQMWLGTRATGRMVGQYDLDAAEHMGLMKQDFLGLRTLDTIDRCVKTLAAEGIVVDPDSWVPDDEDADEEVYAMCAQGYTAGVFQMEGPTNQRGCRQVVPTCFEDLVSITSLYRTGPIMAGFPKQFVDNRQQGHPVYVHPSLAPYLGNTWGVILYQEQVMEIAEHCAGFTMVEVDDIKEAIKHKKSLFMQSLRPKFIKGCRRVARMSRDQATRLWDQIEGYSGYSYNRSHAVAYTFLTYQTARLKYMYPRHYLAALLATVESSKDNEEKRGNYMREALAAGVAFLPPDINASDEVATPGWDGDAEVIRFGLTDLAGIAEKAAAKIIMGRAERPYETVDEVAEAVRNSGTMKVLDASMTLKSIGGGGTMAEAERLLKVALVDPMENLRHRYDSRYHPPGPDTDSQAVTVIGVITSRTTGKTKNGNPYMHWVVAWSLVDRWQVRMWDDTREHCWEWDVGSVVQVTGKWTEKWQNVTMGNPRGIKLLKAAPDATA